LDHAPSFLPLISGSIPTVLVGTWIIMGLLIFVGLLARRSLAAAPDPLVPDEKVSLRSLSEAVVEWLDGFVHDVLENHGYRAMVPYFGCLFLFILFCNFSGLIPGMDPPTGDTDLTFALGVISFFFFIYYGFRAQGLLGYPKSFLGPIWWLAWLMLPIELADNLFRPFSLGVRLYANMFADHTVLSIMTGLVPLIVPLAFYALGTIVSIIQAIIFTVLSITYVRLAAGHDH
jgi:F-type H+-transporting ATPase subunit a